MIVATRLVHEGVPLRGLKLHRDSNLLNRQVHLREQPAGDADLQVTDEVLDARAQRFTKKLAEVIGRHPVRAVVEMAHQVWR